MHFNVNGAASLEKSASCGVEVKVLEIGNTRVESTNNGFTFHHWSFRKTADPKVRDSDLYEKHSCVTVLCSMYVQVGYICLPLRQLGSPPSPLATRTFKKHPAFMLVKTGIM